MFVDDRPRTPARLEIRQNGPGFARDLVQGRERSAGNAGPDQFAEKRLQILGIPVPVHVGLAEAE